MVTDPFLHLKAVKNWYFNHGFDPIFAHKDSVTLHLGKVNYFWFLGWRIFKNSPTTPNFVLKTNILTLLGYEENKVIFFRFSDKIGLELSGRNSYNESFLKFSSYDFKIVCNWTKFFIILQFPETNVWKIGSFTKVEATKELKSAKNGVLVTLRIQ